MLTVDMALSWLPNSAFEQDFADGRPVSGLGDRASWFPNPAPNADDTSGFALLFVVRGTEVITIKEYPILEKRYFPNAGTGPPPITLKQGEALAAKILSLT